MGLLNSSAVKKPPAGQETLEMQVPSLGWEDPLEMKWQPTPVFLLEKSQEQRSLMVYSPKGLSVGRDRANEHTVDLASYVAS